MAAKRFSEASDNDSDRPNHKRLKTPKPSLASVSEEEVITMNLSDKFCAAFEPMFRRVVHEEVENGIRRNLRSLTKSPSLRIQAIDEQPSLQLTFGKNLALPNPIFTGNKITDVDGNYLKVFLVEKSDSTNDEFVQASLPRPVKIEIVVLYGDFPRAGDLDKWTTDEFNESVAKERTGKRPLLAGELSVVMRNGVCSFGEMEFTDNSCWIRSRRFRLGARVAQGASNAQGVTIRPAITESFVVKDHRGESYKKHYPPALGDEVWRLRNIGKNGPFHKKLSEHCINTVQDFLKLSVVDRLKIKQILGMSEKQWDVTLKHAQTCEKGAKLYISRGPDYWIVLNPVCEVLKVKAMIDGQVYAPGDLTPMHKSYIDNLAKDAYENWSNLQEFEGQVNETALLTMGLDEYNLGQSQYTPIHQATSTDGPASAGTGTSIPNNNNAAQAETYPWGINPFGYF